MILTIGHFLVFVVLDGVLELVSVSVHAATTVIVVVVVTTASDGPTASANRKAVVAVVQIVAHVKAGESGILHAVTTAHHLNELADLKRKKKRLKITLVEYKLKCCQEEKTTYVT